MLANRLANRYRHVAKWARRQGITCFRLYERDIPDFPMIVDWYDGDAVAWFYHRTKDDTLEREVAYRKLAEQEILTGLEIPRERLFIKYRARQRDGAGGRDQYERFDSRGAIRTVEEFGLKFEVNLSDYLDTGLFLDHRFTRKMVRERAADQRVLNLFSYTGAFTVHARAGGASATTTVDMSKTYLAWAERNLALNGFTLGPTHQLVHTDCLEFLERGPQEDERYDIIVCDPPTFSNSAKAEDFDVQRHHGDLIRACMRRLTPDGLLVFSNNFRRFKLDADIDEDFEVREWPTQASIPVDFERDPKIHRVFDIRHRA